MNDKDNDIDDEHSQSAHSSQQRLPLRSPRTHKQIIIAHHIILTGYGHWVGSDIRGSGSTDVRNKKLAELGPIHFGRKNVQPSREELREFYRKVKPTLAFPHVWFDEARRQAIGSAFEEAIKKFRYTVYAGAVLRNHAHLVIRRHHDDGIAM